jgi:Kinesin motor domain
VLILLLADAAFGPETSQEQLFRACGVQNLMEKLLDGVNGSLIAYGQTGSGKTFSLWGDVARNVGGGAAGGRVARDSGPGSVGLVPRAINYLYDLAERETSTHDTSRVVIRCGVCEIYAENVRDLLNVTGEALPVKMARDGSFFVAGQAVLTCPTRHEALAVVGEGEANRKVSSHALNQDSSRSHTFLTVMVEHTRMVEPGKEVPGARGRSGGGSGGSAAHGGFGSLVTTRSKCVFVDLAGSERLNETKAEGQTAIESRSINKSLFTLGKVISGLAAASTAQANSAALSPGGFGSPVPSYAGPLMSPSNMARNRRSVSAGPFNSSPSQAALSPPTGGAGAASPAPPTAHIPYRDSKLTKLLADCLGGSSMTIMIACISPARTYVEESLNTLQYAARARRITALSAEEARLKNMTRSDPRDGLIGSLKDENKRLKEELDYLRGMMQSMMQQQKQLQKELESARSIISSTASGGGGSGRGAGSNSNPSTYRGATSSTTDLQQGLPSGRSLTGQVPPPPPARLRPTQWSAPAHAPLHPNASASLGEEKEDIIPEETFSASVFSLSTGGGSGSSGQRRPAVVEDELATQYLKPIVASKKLGQEDGSSGRYLPGSGSGGNTKVPPQQPQREFGNSPPAKEVPDLADGATAGSVATAGTATSPASPFHPERTTRIPMAITSRDDIKLGSLPPPAAAIAAAGGNRSARFPRISEGDEKGEGKEDSEQQHIEEGKAASVGAGAMPSPPLKKAGSVHSGGSGGTASSSFPASLSTPKSGGMATKGPATAGAPRPAAVSTTAAATGGSPS